MFNFNCIRKMKKVLVAVALIATVGVFSSCNKECKCTTYVAGEEISTAVVDNNSDKKCKDLSTVVEAGGKKSGIECK